jgi:CelD/BcsL family acetyltransferase involved in cellulose biosynthesis
VHGTTATLSLVAHAPEYDGLHCGLVCLLDTVRHLIGRGIRRYNLHFRYSPFKARMGGVERRLRDAVIFANPQAAVLWYARRAAAGCRAAAARAVKQSFPQDRRLHS